MISGSLNILEPSGPAQACNGIALPFNRARKQVNVWGSNLLECERARWRPEKMWHTLYDGNY
jgi:hypothetical protein